MHRDEFERRRREIVYLLARKAYRQELLAGGLWTHGDIRDNYYYASYLFAAAEDESLKVPFDRDEAKRKATGVLLNVLKLQDKDESSQTYGHWPLGLHPSPEEAKPNPLPAELMSILMAYFYRQYAGGFEPELRIAFAGAFRHLYASRFFVKAETHYGHHDAKYTAAKLIFGQLFKDEELVRDGHRQLVATLDRIRGNGMAEYGALPWFWHWVQAFTAAWELNEDPAVHPDLEAMLDYLWSERSLYYLKGAWVGPHSRGWPHDMPKDANALHDYVQYGDFLLPEEMPRTEYAGFLFYEAPEEARGIALNRKEPAEVKRLSPRSGSAAGEGGAAIRRYAYITEHYAAGGAWDRAEEFDNEQQRWDVSLPLADPEEEESVNQAYFFHPGAGYKEGDPRHRSRFEEVLFHRNVVLALYPIPEAEDGRIVGVLPKGRWLHEPCALFGQAAGVYIAVHLMKECRTEEGEDRVRVACGEGAASGKTQGAEGRLNGVAMEVVSLEEAGRLGIASLEEFAAARRKLPAVFSGEAARQGAAARLAADYATLAGDRLRLALEEGAEPVRTVNGSELGFADYRP
ncbi:hypothetical protein [Cohnella fermenti]|uniref:DUF2264 domain-containing protein n=1 Tax=Cohnella fermenti TaxID=2565925 RepID=A0A4S4BL93_9BACL|nr:hypothetical protein [Cohnella fermenti]THF74936.1 hypothetical protein E6C55_23610 [Cohnella fermenti]